MSTDELISLGMAALVGAVIIALALILLAIQFRESERATSHAMID